MIPAPAAARTRLDLAAIEATLRGAQEALARLAETEGELRDHMDQEVVDNMLAGYAYLDALHARGVDPLARGYVEELLELNRLVLCGTDSGHRARYSEHLAASEARFYEQPGIGDLVETLALERPESHWERAAVAYLRLSAQPQLFLEGNHRTGVLVIGAILLEAGEPPFVLSADNAEAFFAASAEFRGLEKNSLRSLFREPALRREFAEFLYSQRRQEYLSHD
ncbi:MAG TPA: hypothetical protein VKF40_31065 [Burkholderiales bacterium]|nr:hypothetical protein [Burkholderiales bacterium]